MPIFSYVALKNGKEIVKGEVTASNLKDARDVIRKMGYVPTQINEFNENKNKKTDNLSSLSLSEKMDFISTLQILLQSGIPAVESLMFMEQESAKKKIKTMSRILKTQIMAGSTFADTMARYPQVFGYIFIGLIKAGEEAGELEKTLGRINELLTKQDNTKNKVIGTLMYPIFVVLLAIIVMLVMLLFVFPAFKGMFETMDKKLPAITSWMINTGDYLKEFWYTIPIFIVLFVFAIIVIFRWEPSRNLIDKFVLKVPFLNDLVKFSNFSNFLSVLSVSYDAGIPVVDCLHLAVITLTNSTLKNKLSTAIVRVQQGMQVSQALKASGEVPNMLLFMISTGEQSGKLGEMLQKGVVYLDKILDKVIDTITKAIEPIMLLVIGGIVLTMALALYLPLFQSYMS